MIVPSFTELRVVILVFTILEMSVTAIIVVSGVTAIVDVVIVGGSSSKGLPFFCSANFFFLLISVLVRGTLGCLVVLHVVPGSFNCYHNVQLAVAWEVYTSVVFIIMI